MIFGYRLVCFIAGLLVLYEMHKPLYRLFIYLVQSREFQSHVTAGQMLAPLAGQMILLPVGIYLILGAPAFVRWQVRKARAMMENTTESSK